MSWLVAWTTRARVIVHGAPPQRRGKEPRVMDALKGEAQKQDLLVAQTMSDRLRLSWITPHVRFDEPTST